MVDETQQGIEIGIDSTPAEAGKSRVIKSLSDIKAAVDKLASDSSSASDKMAAGFGRIADAAEKSVRSLNDIKAASSNSTTALNQGFGILEGRLNHLVILLSQTNSSINQIASTSQRVSSNTFSGATKGAQDFGSALEKVKALLLGFGLVEFAKSVAETDIKFTGFNQSLKAVFGTQQAATQQMQFASKVAAEYGFRVQDVVGSYVQFAAASRGTNLEGQRTQAIFSAIVKAGTAYHLTNEQLKGSLLAVQQMISKGTVQAEELRGQLGERLPGAFNIAARAIGVTTKQLNTMLQNGQVVAEDFLPKFARQLEQEVPNGVTHAQAAFSAFLSSLDEAKVAIAEGGLFEGLATGAKSLADVLKTMGDSGQLRQIGTSLGEVIKILAQLAPLLPEIITGWAAYKVAAIGAEIATAALSTTLEASPIGAVASALAILIVALNNSGTANDQLNRTVGDLNKVYDDYNKMVQNGTAFTNLNAQASIDNVNAKLQEAEAIKKVAQAHLDSIDASEKSTFGQVQRSGFGFGGFVAAAGTRALDWFNRRKYQGQVDQVNDAERKAGKVKGMMYLQNLNSAGNIQAVKDEFAPKAGNATNQTAALATAQAKLLAATNPLQKAQAQYNIDRIQGNAAVKAGTMTTEDLTQKLAADLQAIQAAKDGIKQHAAALRDSKKAATEAITDENKLQAIMSRWNDQPNFIDQANKDKRSLDEMVGKWVSINGQVVKYTQTMANQGKAAIDQGMNKPFRDLISQQENSLAVQALAAKGYTDQADALQTIYSYQQRYGALLPGQTAQIKEMATLQEAMARISEQYQQKIQVYTQTVDDLRQTTGDFLNTLMSGDLKKGFKGLFQGLQQDLRNQTVRALTQDLFGGLDDEIKDFVTGRTGVQQAVDVLKSNMDKSGTAAGDLADALQKALAIVNAAINSVGDPTSSYSPDSALSKLIEDKPFNISSNLPSQLDLSKFNGMDGQPLAASNDNQEIVVNGHPSSSSGSTQQTKKVGDVFAKSIDSVLGRAFNLLPKSLQTGLKSVGKTVTSGLDKLGIKIPKSLGSVGTVVSKGLKGIAIGQTASGIIGALGLKQSKTGASIGGGIGNIVGGPIGGIIGGILGGTIGGLFKKAQKGGATVGNTSTGAIGVLGTVGNNASMKAAGTAAGNSISSGITSLASQLGGQVGTFGNITIGQYKGKWRVNTQGTKLGGSSSPVPGLMDFGKDGQDAAIAYAIQQAVKQGAIQGISQATQNVLSKATNLDSVTAAASTYEQLLTQAAKLADPIKGALDETAKGVSNTVALLKQAGYSTADIAKIQIALDDQQKQALTSLTKGYQDFIDNIQNGSDSGKSIYEQFLAAQKKLSTVQAGLATGASTQDDFTNAGQNVLQLAGQVYGTSTKQFTDIRDQLVSAAQSQIDAANAANAANSSAAVAAAVTTTAAAAAGQRETTNTYLAQILQNLTGSSASAGYVGGLLQYAKVGNF